MSNLDTYAQTLKKNKLGFYDAASHADISTETFPRHDGNLDKTALLATWDTYSTETDDSSVTGQLAGAAAGGPA